MKFLHTMKTSAVWLFVPALLVLCGVGWAVSHYEPLVFDASLYETEAESSLDIDTIDAAALEAADTGASGEASAAAVSVGELADGTWTGYAACGKGNEDGWKPYYVAVTITVSGGAVTGIAGIEGTSGAEAGDETLSWDAGENQAYLDWAISGRSVGATSYTGVGTQLEAAIAAGSRPTSVDTVSGATYSSKAIFDAYYDALSKAAAAAGSNVQSASLSGDSSVQASVSSILANVTAAVSADELSTLADGTWTGYAACGKGNEDGWKPYYVAVTITVSGGAVTGIAGIEGTSGAEASDETLSWDAGENQAYLDWAISGRTRSGTFYTGVQTQLEASIEAGAYPSTIDTVSGATYSSKAIFDAYYAALSKAAQAGGSTVETVSSEEATQDASQDDDADATTQDDTASDGEQGDADDEEEADVLISTAGMTLLDGTYTGAAFCQDEDSPSSWSPYYVIVKITVADGAVSEITKVYGDTTGVVDANYTYNASENASYFNWANTGRGLTRKGVTTQIQACLDAGEDPSGIDVVSSATWSSYAIMHAYIAAVEQAIEATEAAENGEEYDASGIKVYKEDDDEEASTAAITLVGAGGDDGE